MSAIYFLLEPDDNRIRYAGGTTREPWERYLEHTAESRENDGNHKSNWIRKLKRQGKKPILFVLEYIECGLKEILKREIEVIAELRALGCNLVNSTDGGDGVVGRIYTDAQRAALSAAGKKRFEDPALRAKVSDQQKEYIKTHPEERDRLSKQAKEAHRNRTKEETSFIRSKQSASILETFKNPEVIEKMSKAQLDNWANNEERRRNTSDLMIERYTNEEEREKQRQIQLKRYEDPEERRKTSEALRLAASTQEGRAIKSKASKGVWASYTPEQRATRIEALAAGKIKKKEQKA